MFDRVKDKMYDWKDRLACAVHPEPVFAEDTMTDDDSLDDPKKPAQPSKDPNIGADPVIKVLYEGKNSRPGHIDWVDIPPRQLSKRAARIHDRTAIRVYKMVDREKPAINGRFALKYHNIELQNQTVIEELKEILKKEDVHLDASDNVKFSHPFMPLYFCHDDIRAAFAKADEGSVLKEQLSLFLKVLADIFNGVKARVRNLKAGGLISFPLAWCFFPKGSIVYAPDRDCERLYKVKGTDYKKSDNGAPLFCVQAEEIQFDGESFVWKDTELKMKGWSGNAPITELEYYPLEFHEDPAAVKARSAARGKLTLDFQGLTYCEYTGLGILSQCGKLEKHNVDGRVLIDTYGYSKHHLGLTRKGNQDKQISKHKITSPAANTIIDVTGLDSTWIVDANGEVVQMGVNGQETQDGANSGSDNDDSYLKRLSEKEQQENKSQMLKRQSDLIYISPLVKGFALKNKLWLNFYVEDLKPVVWNDEAYDHLVYPEEQKDLLLSFVQNHHTNKISNDDVILGKGQGLITLLSGPPGTGKTLTAEAIADKTRRPLLYLQAEDLGIIASSLGENLKKFFEMAIDWDAVILLDEADVFMAERHPNDIARNELVSIFLREMEYFRGCIFLTTNLFDTIDIAFRSRVSIHLLFNPLPPQARQILWRKFLDRLPKVTVEDENGTKTQRSMAAGITEEDIKELGRFDLNGREIKNAVKTVKSWCESKSYDVTLLRIESAVKVTAPQSSKQGEAVPDLYD